MALSKDEAQLVAVYRAMLANGSGNLDVGDVGSIIVALHVTGDLEEREENYTEKEVKAYLQGFISSYELFTTEEPHLIDARDWEPFDEPIAGGPSNQIVAGQGSDPGYVTQSGVPAEELKDSE